MAASLSANAVAAAQSASPSAPAKTAPTAGKGARVEARFGTHDGYDRLVLEWPMPVHPRLHSAGGMATITFDAAAKLNLTRLNAVLPEEMRPAKLRPDGMALSFRIPAGRTLRDHSSGNLVIVDLADEGGETASTGEAAAAPVPAAERAPPSPTPAPPPAPPASAPGEGFSEIVLADTPDRQLQITATPIDDGFSFRFKWPGHVKAAIFKLRTTLWCVFSQPERAAFNPQAAGAEHVPEMQQVDNNAASVFRIAVPAATRIFTSRIGTDWVVDMRQPNPHRPPDAIQPDRILAAANGVYQTKQPGQPVTIVDPDSGEVLLAVPIYTAGKHFEAATDYKTYIALPTSQGMLFRPEGDIARFLIQPEGVRVVNAVPTISKDE